MLNTAQTKYISKILNPLIYRAVFLVKLPSIFFWGAKVTMLDEEKCIVVMKQRWTNQNPFRSIYFSALNGAAELSTGILVQMHLQGRGEWSMLVTGFEASFTKKATGKISFHCEQGILIQQVIDSVQEIGKSVDFTVLSKALNEENNVVAEFKLKWSLKRKA